MSFDDITLRRLSDAGMKALESIVTARDQLSATEVERRVVALGDSAKPLGFAARLPQWAYGDDRFVTIVRLHKALQDVPPNELDKGFWSWLSVYRFRGLSTLAKASGRPDPQYNMGDFPRWVPSSVARMRHRHLLRTPYEVYDSLASDERSVRFLLHGTMGKGGEVFEQFAANQRLVGSRGIIRAAATLYFDESAGCHRPRVTSEVDGARAFVKVIKQLLRTYDVARMESDQILALLPRQRFSAVLPKV